MVNYDKLNNKRSIEMDKKDVKKWQWPFIFLVTLQLLWPMGLHVTFHILYMTLYIPHVSLGLHYIKIITKDNIHIRQWLYETKQLIGQTCSQIDNSLDFSWICLLMKVCHAVNYVAMTLIRTSKL